MREIRLSQGAMGDLAALQDRFWTASFGQHVTAQGDAQSSGSRPQLDQALNHASHDHMARVSPDAIAAAESAHTQHPAMEHGALPGDHFGGHLSSHLHGINAQLPNIAHHLKDILADNLSTAHDDLSAHLNANGGLHNNMASLGDLSVNIHTPMASAPNVAQHTAFEAMQSGPLQHFDSQLAALYYEHSSQANAMKGFTSTIEQTASALHEIKGHQYVSIDVTAADGNGQHLLHQLETLGLKFGAHYGADAGGLLDVRDIGALAKLGNVREAHESGMATSVGVVTSQTDHAQHNDDARTNYTVDGTGIKVGILSDTFNHTAPGGDNMAADIANGDLPAATTIYQDWSSGEDEGRGMAQLVHDLAPGASIEFATAFSSEAGFAQNIQHLADDGAKVIVDDVSYFDEPYFQDGIVSQAVDQVVQNNGVTYFSSAANNANHGFEANWQASSTVYNTDTLAKMDSAGDTFLSFTLPTGWNVPVTLQWDSPSADTGGSHTSQNDLNVYVFNSANTSSLKTSSTTSNVNGSAYERVNISNSTGSTQTYYIAVGLHAGSAPGEFKMISFDNGLGSQQPFGASDFNFNNGTISGHPAASNAIAVGAAYFDNTPAFHSDPALKEGFSSVGPTRILFDIDGNQLSTPDVRETPEIVAADGGNTTFFGTTGTFENDTADGDIYPNFFGTSAAAPDAAATAALMLQAQSGLNHTDILHLLEDTAHDMDSAGFDSNTGFGLIDADGAVGAAKNLTIVGNSNHEVLQGTHLGDKFTFATGFGTSSFVNGGGGTDTLALSGGASVNFNSSTVVSVEKITLDDSNYTLKLVNGNVASGKSLTVDASALGSSHHANINGAAETDGTLTMKGGAGADTFTGGHGKDTLTGGAGGDVLKGGGAADKLTGGAGSDKFVYAGVTDSASTKHDTVTDFDASADKFDLSFAVHSTGSRTGTVRSSHFDSDLTKLLKGHLASHEAVVVHAGSRTYLVVDADGKAGYKGGHDMVIDITHASHLSSLSTHDFI